MRNQTVGLGVAAVIVLLSGCATPIKYSYSGKLFKAQESRPIVAVVDTFQDLRTPDEHEGTFSVTKNYLYTRDKLFKKNIGDQVTLALKRHLEQSKVLDKVIVRDIGSITEENLASLQPLIAEGISIVIAGDLHHFYGYQSGKGSSGVAAAFGLAGVLTEALINKKVVGGRATLGDLKIIDVPNQKILWQGDLDFDFERKEIFYDGAQAYAIEALKMVNDQFVQKTDEVLKTQ